MNEEKFNADMIDAFVEAGYSLDEAQRALSVVLAFFGKEHIEGWELANLLSGHYRLCDGYCQEDF